MVVAALLGDGLNDDGTQHAGQRAHAVGQAHEDAGVARGDVQVVHVEACNTHIHSRHVTLGFHTATSRWGFIQSRHTGVS